jgi:cytochrome c oxidase assembly factor CtaG
VVTLLSHPLVGLALFTGSLWVTHFSPIYELALENPFVHDLEHVLYLTAALLFWGPIIGADPVRARLPHPVRLVLILFAMVQGSFLGVVIVLAPAPLYAHYQNLHLDYITPLADQQMAGAAMWVVGAILIPLWGGLVFYEWMRAEEAAGIREDARIARAAAAERTRAEAAKRGSEDEARAEVGALRSEEEAKASASQPGRESPPLAPPPLAQGGSDVTAVPSPSASRLQPLASSSADGPASDTLLQA